MSWDIVATVKETQDVIERFVAHHVVLGARRIWLFFDDPTDPAISAVESIPQVRLVRCDLDHWQALGGRPRRIEVRQMRNARMAYRDSEAEWIIHIDADEFVDADRPVNDVLNRATTNVVRLAPFEMLSFQRSRRTNEPTHIFRGPLPAGPRGSALADQAYGPFHHCLRRGMLSHIAGKFFVRTGIDGASLRIHVPEFDGKRFGGETAEDARLLHMHGGEWEEWRDKVVSRLKEGAYTAKHDQRKALQLGVEATINYQLTTLMETDGEAGLKRFYDRVCRYDRTKRGLKAVGALHRSSPWLEEKRADLFGGRALMKGLSEHKETGDLEATVEYDGLSLRIAPDLNLYERGLALGRNEDEALVQDLLKIVDDHSVIEFGARTPYVAAALLRTLSKPEAMVSVRSSVTAVERLMTTMELNGVPKEREYSAFFQDTTESSEVSEKLGRLSRGDKRIGVFASPADKWLTQAGIGDVIAQICDRIFVHPDLAAAGQLPSVFTKSVAFETGVLFETK